MYCENKLDYVHGEQNESESTQKVKVKRILLGDWRTGESESVKTPLTGTRCAAARDPTKGKVLPGDLISPTCIEKCNLHLIFSCNPSIGCGTGPSNVRKSKLSSKESFQCNSNPRNSLFPYFFETNFFFWRLKFSIVMETLLIVFHRLNASWLVLKF